MYKKAVLVIIVSTCGLVAILGLLMYFMPYVLIDRQVEQSVLRDLQPNRYTLPIVVRMAEHGISSGGGGYTKSGMAPEWAELISRTRDPNAIDYLHRLSKHEDPFINRNAMKAIQEIEKTAK